MRFQTICRNNDFSRAYTKGKSYVHPHIVVYVNKNRAKKTRIGITTTKKIGKAVVRNRARRVIRAALASVLPSENVGAYDIVLVSRALTPKLKSTQLAVTLDKILHEAGILQ